MPSSTHASARVPFPTHPRRRRRRHLARTAVGGVVVGAVTFFASVAASAHVHVDPSTTEPGAFSVLTFRVPTESATASTTKVEVTLPSDDPFPSVSAKAMTGWTVTVTEAKLPKPVVDDDGATLTKAPHTVTWTAGAGAAVEPGQFGEFVLQVGPLPDSGTVVLPAVQTYSDGSTSTWDEATAAGGAEPEHPAPSFEVTAAAVPAAENATSTTDGTARTLGVVGILVGAIGVGIGPGRRDRGPAAKAGVRLSPSTGRAGSRTLALLAAFVTIAIVVVLAGVAPARAHDVLVRTDPADGSTVARLPSVIVLTFDEPGQADGTVVTVTGPSGDVASGTAMLVDSDVRQAVGPGSPAGRYTVNWRVVSADGHPVDGTFSFTATTGTSGTATPRPTDAPTIPAAAGKSGATGWAIGAVVAIFAMGIGAILLYRRRPDTGGDD